MPRILSHLPLEEQKAAILSLIWENAENAAGLEAALAEVKVKPRAMKEVIRENSALFKENEPYWAPGIVSCLQRKYLSEKIGTVKQRPVVAVGEKNAGATEGRWVKKARREGEVAAPKHDNEWMQKNGPKKKVKMPDGKRLELINKGEEICEYLGSTLIAEIYEQMGYEECSPKVRLHKAENSTVTVLSKKLPDFSTVRELDSLADKAKARGFAVFFVASMLVGDYDLHATNVGFRRIGDKIYWARIDMGKALTYNIARGGGPDLEIIASHEPVSVGEYVFILYANNRGHSFRDEKGGRTSLYTTTDFTNLRNLCEMLQVEAKLDTSHFSFILERAFQNITEAYGEDWMKDPLVRKTFEKRMGIAMEEPLTQERIQETILGNIHTLREDLEKYAKRRIANIFPRNAEQVFTTYNALSGQDGVNYGEFFRHLAAEGCAFESKEQLQLAKLIGGNERRDIRLFYDIMRDVSPDIAEKLLAHPDIESDMLTGCIRNMISRPEYRNDNAVLLFSHPKNRVYMGGLIGDAFRSRDRELSRWLHSIQAQLPDMEANEKELEEGRLSSREVYDLAAQIVPNHINIAIDAYEEHLSSKEPNSLRFVTELVRKGVDISTKQNFNLKFFLELLALGTKKPGDVLLELISGNSDAVTVKILQHPDISKKTLKGMCVFLLKEGRHHGYSNQLPALLLHHLGREEGDAFYIEQMTSALSAGDQTLVDRLQDTWQKRAMIENPHTTVTGATKENNNHWLPVIQRKLR